MNPLISEEIQAGSEGWKVGGICAEPEGTGMVLIVRPRLWQLWAVPMLVLAVVLSRCSNVSSALWGHLGATKPGLHTGLPEALTVNMP
jgi:hypothetical protein